MLKKYFPVALIIFLLFTIFSLWLYPTATPVLGLASLLFSLAISICAIFEKHKGTENPRPKIAKDTLMLVFTVLLVIFLGGIAAMLANFHVSPSFGAVAGIISAITASFAMGYFIKNGVGRLSG